MTAKSERVVALIVNYNSTQDLIKCLDSLLCARVDSVFILDNASIEGERAGLSVLVGRPGVTVLYGAENVGFGAGVNRLASVVADSPETTEDTAIWIVNPDSTVEVDTARLLHAEIDRGSLDVAFPAITNGGGANIWFAGGQVDLKRGLTVHSLYGEDVTKLPHTTTSSEFVSGANFMLKMSTWKRVGGYDERLFLYWEDAEWSIRANHLNLRIGLVPSARSAHSQGGSSGGSLSPTYYYYAQRNRLVVAEQYGSSKLGVLLGLGLGETFKLLLRPVWRGHWKAVLSGVIGLRDGVRGVMGPRPRR